MIAAVLLAGCCAAFFTAAFVKLELLATSGVGSLCAVGRVANVSAIVILTSPLSFSSPLLFIKWGPCLNSFALGHVLLRLYTSCLAAPLGSPLLLGITRLPSPVVLPLRCCVPLLVMFLSVGFAILVACCFAFPFSWEGVKGLSRPCLALWTSSGWCGVLRLFFCARRAG